MSETLAYIENVLDWVFAYGPVLVYTVIFAACFIENVFPPFPGDTFILAGGGLVAAGRLDMIPTALSVVSGGMLSVILLYLLGRNYGRDFFVKRNYKLFSAADVDAIERKLARWGGPLLVASRFIMGMRVALVVGAGIGRYPISRMLLFSTISYIMFTSVLMYAAIKLVENIDRIEYYAVTYYRIVWPIVITLVVVVVTARIVSIRRNRNR